MVTQVRLSEISKNYMRGWFFIDVLSCAPVQYIQLLLAPKNRGDDSGDAGSVRAFKVTKPMHD